ncbi:ATP cone domain-containing protein, partial [Cupriavidus basilensis]
MEHCTEAVVASLPSEVIKRNGEKTAFAIERIQSALRRAGVAAGEFNDAQAASLAEQVARVLAYRFHDQTPGVEQIQDVAEQVLIAANYWNTARAFIAYRGQHARLRQDRKALVDVEASINEYLSKADWRVNANANQGYSLGGLIL